MSSDLFDIGYRATQYDVIEGYENPSSINANKLLKKSKKNNKSKDLTSNNEKIQDNLDDLQTPYNGLGELLYQKQTSKIENTINKNKVLESSTELHNDLYEDLKDLAYHTIQKLPHQMSNSSLITEHNSHKLIHRIKHNLLAIKGNYDDIKNKNENKLIQLVEHILEVVHWLFKHQHDTFHYMPGYSGSQHSTIMNPKILSTLNLTHGKFKDHRHRHRHHNYDVNIYGRDKQLTKFLDSGFTQLTNQLKSFYNTFKNFLVYKTQIDSSGVNFSDLITLFNSKISDDAYDDSTYNIYSLTSGKTLESLYPKDYLLKQRGILSGYYRWCFQLRIYMIKQHYGLEINQLAVGVMRSEYILKNYNHTMLTNYLTSVFDIVDIIIDNFVNNTYLTNTHLYNSTNIYAYLPFKTIIYSQCFNSDFKNCCANLKTISSSTEDYLLKCTDKTFLNKIQSMVELETNTYGLDQFYEFFFVFNVAVLNYALCTFLRDRYCHAVISKNTTPSVSTDSETTTNSFIKKYLERYIMKIHSNNLTKLNVGSSTTTTTEGFSAYDDDEDDNEDTSVIREGFKWRKKKKKKKTSTKTTTKSTTYPIYTTSNSGLDTNNIKFNASVSDMLDSTNVTVNGSSMTLKSYSETIIDSSNCTPTDTPYFSASYKCGNVSANVINKKTISDYVTFDCSSGTNDKYKCNTFRLELMDDGKVVIMKEGNKNKVYWSWKPNISTSTANTIIHDFYKNSSHSNYLDADKTLENSDYLVSKNKTFKLINTGGSLKLHYATRPCYIDNKGEYFGYTDTSDGKKGIGLYMMNHANIKHVGKSGYIDQDGKMNLYKNKAIGFTDEYLKAGNFAVSENSKIKGTASINKTILTDKDGNEIFVTDGDTEACETKCNLYDDCGGFTYKDGICRLKNSNMFPKGLRKADTNTQMFVRIRGIKDSLLDSSCPVFEEDSNVPNSLVDDFMKSRSMGKKNRMPGDACNMKNLAAPYLKFYAKSKVGYASAEKELLAALNKLTMEEKQQVKKFKMNIKNMEKDINEYDKIYKNLAKEYESQDTISTSLNESTDYMNQKSLEIASYGVIALATVFIAMSLMKN